MGISSQTIDMARLKLTVAGQATQLCDDSKDGWRKSFPDYDGMAKIDWEDYLVPYNWRIRVENTTTEQFAPPTCTRPSHYFGVFVAENLLLLPLIVAYAA